MCNPALLIPAALTMAGAGLHAYTNSSNQATASANEAKAFKVSRDARLAELKRQADFHATSQTALDNTTTALAKPAYEANQNASIADFMNTVDNSSPGVVPEGFKLQGQGDATTEISAEIAKRAATAAAEARTRVQALAKLGSYGAAGDAGNAALTDNANQLSTTNGLARGSLGVSNLEQSIPAAQTIPGDNLLADLLAGAGGVASGMNGLTLPKTTWAPAWNTLTH